LNELVKYIREENKFFLCKEVPWKVATWKTKLVMEGQYELGP